MVGKPQFSIDRCTIRVQLRSGRFEHGRRQGNDRGSDDGFLHQGTWL
jgi:hypothetical protein